MARQLKSIYKRGAYETLRNYNTVCKNEDEIIILSEKETKAIFALMEVIKDNSTRSLPF